MTIESQIAELTAAVNKLADVFAKYTGPVYAVSPALPAVGALKEAQDNTQPGGVTWMGDVEAEEVKKRVAGIMPKKKPEPKAEKAKPTEEPKAEAVEYSQVRDKVLDLIKADPNNRAKVLGALEKFGVTTAKELKPAQYAEALEALNNIKVV